jgi:hypothetical protein
MKKESLSDQMKIFEGRTTDFIRKACKTKEEEAKLFMLKVNGERQKKKVVKEDGDSASKKDRRNHPSSSSDDDKPRLFREDDNSRTKSRKLITLQE